MGNNDNTELLVHSILETLKYSNYFQFPLTVNEIHKFMDQPVEFSGLSKLLNENNILKKKSPSWINFIF